MDDPKKGIAELEAQALAKIRSCIWHRDLRFRCLLTRSTLSGLLPRTLSAQLSCPGTDGKTQWISIDIVEE